MDHGVVQRWLRDVVQTYNDADRVFADVDRVLIAVSSLSPKTEVYTYDDGRTQLLLLLSGTIPIQYRGATYNIPLDIWVPRIYPREMPIVYVRPTNDMLIRKSINVDPSGRVGGDYLQRWERKWEACNLLELVHSCQSIFGQEPPVYAKPKQAQAMSPASPSASGSRATLDLRERQPPPPPQPRPSPPRTIATSVVPAKAGLHSSRVPSNLTNGHGGHGWERIPDNRQASWHAPSEILSPSWTRSSQHRSASMDVPYPGHHVQPASPPTIPPVPPHQHLSMVVASPPTPSAAQPPPPRPPNPELLQIHGALHHKIQSRLQYLRDTVGEEQRQLRLLMGDLDRGEPAIRDEKARLEAVRDVCKATGDGLEESVTGARNRIEELRMRAEPDVDGMICATSIVGNQLLELVASDSAIGDTLFYLGQALHSEAIEVERYLKQTRFLAREQFMRRALAQKITDAMGW